MQAFLTKQTVTQGIACIKKPSLQENKAEDWVFAFRSMHAGEYQAITGKESDVSWG